MYIKTYIHKLNIICYIYIYVIYVIFILYIIFFFFTTHTHTHILNIIYIKKSFSTPQNSPHIMLPSHNKEQTAAPKKMENNR